MYSVGRLFYVINIGLSLVFAPLFLTSCWYFFIYAPEPSVLNNIPMFLLVIGLPFLIFSVSLFLVCIGFRMQYGKSGRIGGIFAIFFGLLSYLIAIVTPADPTTSDSDARSALRGFGEQMTDAGLKLVKGEDVKMAYPFDAPYKKLYGQRKKDLAVFSIVGILTILTTYTIFKFFS